jgi:hypothetical protein
MVSLQLGRTVREHILVREWRWSGPLDAFQCSGPPMVSLQLGRTVRGQILVREHILVRENILVCLYYLTHLNMAFSY